MGTFLNIDWGTNDRRKEEKKVQPIFYCKEQQAIVRINDLLLMPLEIRDVHEHWKKRVSVMVGGVTKITEEKSLR